MAGKEARKSGKAAVNTSTRELNLTESLRPLLLLLGDPHLILEVQE